MDNIINKFDAAMEKYNEVYTQAVTQVEQDKVNAEYEVIIASAESVLESEIEAEIKKQEAELEAEQKTSEEESKKLESENKKDNTSLIMEKLVSLTAKELTKKYKIKDADAIAKLLNVKRPKDTTNKKVKELEYWKFLQNTYKQTLPVENKLQGQ